MASNDGDAAPLRIREAARNDIPIVFALIRELADYEKLAHEVEASEKSLAAALFEPGANVFCDLAFFGAEPVGVAVWFKNFSTFSGRAGIYLEDIYVREAWRGRGVGRALLSRLAQRCCDNGWSRLQWSVLDWNAPAIAFYRSLGGEPMAEWRTWRLRGEALSRLAAGGGKG